mgnify:CR=1 FL=1
MEIKVCDVQGLNQNNSQATLITSFDGMDLELLVTKSLSEKPEELNRTIDKVMEDSNIQLAKAINHRVYKNSLKAMIENLPSSLACEHTVLYSMYTYCFIEAVRRVTPIIKSRNDVFCTGIAALETLMEEAINKSYPDIKKSSRKYIRLLKYCNSAVVDSLECCVEIVSDGTLDKARQLICVDHTLYF